LTAAGNTHLHAQVGGVGRERARRLRLAGAKAGQQRAQVAQPARDKQLRRGLCRRDGA